MIYFENGVTEKINFIDVINIKNQKGYRLTNFDTKIEKGNYQCIIQSDTVAEKNNEKVVVKIISLTNKEESYSLKIKEINTILSK